MNEQLHLSRPQTPNEPNVATRAHNPAPAELPGGMGTKPEKFDFNFYSFVIC